MKRALKAVPGLQALHIRYHHHRLRVQAGVLARDIVHLHRGASDPEVREVVEALQAGPLRMIPYAWVGDYLAADVETGVEDRLPYAVVRGQRVYFPAHYTAPAVRFAVAEALYEQDERSPHRYRHGPGCPATGDAAVLIGASDGIFALSILPSLRRLWVFEPDPKWQEPLARTLSPWRDRVEIVSAFVGAQSRPGAVSLDDFFRVQADVPDFIQADVEGGEHEVLAGARRLIQSAPRLALSVCTYHRQGDFETLSRTLASMGCRVAPSRGYVIVHSQVLEPPYLRRAVVYASKASA
ncbi:MAG: FkbM family methyltransferase [Anaeromyxobacter sp.]